MLYPKGCYLVLFVITAIVFVVHAYPLRFVFLVAVGIGFGSCSKACSGFPQRLIAPYISRRGAQAPRSIERYSPGHTPR